MPTIESAHLEYRQGGSDKVYNVSLDFDGTTYEVNFSYGRRGSTLTYGTKIRNVFQSAAKKVYDKLLNEKLGKGYVDTGASSSSGTIVKISSTLVKKASGFLPQLLNEIQEDEVEDYLTDTRYCMQEKFDGERRSLIFEDGAITATNKKGQEIGLSGEIGKAFLELADKASSRIILDGEDMGDYIMLFDMIGPDHYLERYNNLVKTVGDNPVLRVCKTAYTTKDKKALYKEIFDRNGEGVVFKHINSKYSAGRSNNCLKFKFKDTATCVVLGVNEGKRSIKIGAYDHGNITAIGNVTVYPNQVMPKLKEFVEVEYLYYYEGGSLFQPVLKGVRTDVTIEDCDIDKLKRKPENAE